ncbi:hypothetical protein ES705_12904 [subsurface metagenome]
MKTLLTNKNGFPKLTGILLVIAAISLLCFVNCLVANAGEQKKDKSKKEAATTFEALISAEEESEAKVEEWMIDSNVWSTTNSSSIYTEEFDSEIEIKPWMLNFADSCLAQIKDYWFKCKSSNQTGLIVYKHYENLISYSAKRKKGK